MRRIPVAASAPYEILLGLPLSGCGAEIRAATGSAAAVIVTDSNVAPLYLAALKASLQRAGLRAAAFTIPAGEASKNAENYLRLLDFLAAQELTRSDCVVALGGGVVGDLAGFAAATYLRGVQLVQLPTSLLAMVDSSVGGKTAIDLPAGKNLCGAFHQPRLVCIDCSVLATLPERERAAGLGEIIKYALLRDPALLAPMEPEEQIARSLAVKAALVTEDERDNGARQLLNLGHTVGHAVEQQSGYRLLHGECVSIGMAVITRAATAHGLCGSEVLPALEAALNRNALPSRSPAALQELLPYLMADKKRRGGSITLIVPEAIGRCRMMNLPVSELEDWLEPGFEE